MTRGTSIPKASAKLGSKLSQTTELALELLAPLGPVRARRMFGGHGVYLADVFVALVADERLYLKVNDSTRQSFADAGCEPFIYSDKHKPMTLNYWTVPADAMESPDAMAPWARLALGAALGAALAARTVSPRPRSRLGAGPLVAKAAKARPEPGSKRPAKA